MSAIFPSPEWLKALEAKLNSDEQYARIAKNWEGDFLFIVEPGGPLKEQILYYMDLWHGKCRKTSIPKDISEVKPAFVMRSPYENFSKVLKGELEVMQALLTRKVQLQGSMAYMMRNVPVVLDFVRVARENTKEIL